MRLDTQTHLGKSNWTEMLARNIGQRGWIEAVLTNQSSV